MAKLSVVVYVIAVCSFSAAGVCPNIQNREKWGGRTSLAIEYLIIPVQYVVIHHTVSQKCSTFLKCSQQVANIQYYHMHDLGWNDIGYNFLIGNDGNIYEGVGWNKVGAHTRGYNKKSIGIAFLGNFSNELPTQVALQAAKDLLSCGVESCQLSRNYRLLGARQLKPTESPGLQLYNEIQNWDNWVASP